MRAVYAVVKVPVVIGVLILASFGLILSTTMNGIYKILR
jgi:hypothetical protein